VIKKTGLHIDCRDQADRCGSCSSRSTPPSSSSSCKLLVQDELGRRADRLFARRLKQASITQIKELKDFDWRFNPKIPKSKIVDLATARFVREQENALLTGPPGVGKSHIVTAIVIGAIRAGYRARVRSAFDLAADFAEAEATGERKQLVQTLAKVDLLVVEDFGMKRLGPNAAEDFLPLNGSPAVQRLLAWASPRRRARM
jgi:DNA replication protein DnaC